MRIGIIGGSGLEDPHIMEQAREQDISTPYGKPSSPLIMGKIAGIDVAILSRHGRKHTIMPTNVPFQANVSALKKAGCTHVIATTACGSLKESIKPGDFVFVNQFIDRTTKRASTFHEKNHVCHLPMAEPFCRNLRKLLYGTAKALKLRCHQEGTVVTVEGPRFSTKAESLLFRSWNADVINMSTVPEVVLAREAGLHYAAIAMSTDYDCWKDDEAVNIEKVLAIFRQNAESVVKLIVSTIPKIREYDDCPCPRDIKAAMMS